MGGTQSANGGSEFFKLIQNDPEFDLYDAYLTHYVFKNQPNSSAIVGGKTVKKLGGLDALENYASSVYAKSKEDAIRSIAKAIGPLIKYNRGAVDPIDKVVAELKKAVPTKSSGDRPIKSDKYADFCKALAKAINREWKMDLIDINAKPHIICDQVARVMESYFRGLDGEFMAVAGEVHKIIRNLEILQQLLDALHKKIFADLESSPEAETAQQAEHVQALYNAAKNEIRRKLAILSNLINTNIGDVQSNLMDIFTDKKEFVGLTEELENAGISSPQYGDVLSNLVDGFSNIAYSANLVNDALKKLDIDFKDYKKVQSKSELQELLYKSMAGKKYNSSDLLKLLELAKLVRENEEYHDNIVEYLDKKVKGGYTENEYTLADSVANKTWQDTSKTPFEGRINAPKSIGKQLFEQKKVRMMIMNDLNKQIKRHYLSIVETLAKISARFGNDIKITPDIENFVKLLVHFDNSHPEKKNLHLALSGYKTDATSSYVKYNYLTFLDTIKRTAEELSRGSSGGNALFKELSDKITQLIKEIDKFNTTFSKVLTGVYFTRTTGKYGGDEFVPADAQPNTPAQSETPANRVDVFQESSAPSVVENKPVSSVPSVVENKPVSSVVESQIPYEGTEILGGIISKMDSSNFKYFITLKKAIREMEYYIKISGIKSAIQRNAEENKNNTAKYETILGEEAAFLINEIQSMYNATVASIHGKINDPSKNLKYKTESDRYLVDSTFYKYPAGGAKLADFTLNTAFNAVFAGNEKDKKDYIEGSLYLLEFIRSAKIEMLEAAQALDLYLSKFTQNLEKNPDSIRSYVQILEQVEMVAKWYTEKSGDFLCAVFEAFPADDVVSEASYESAKSSVDIGNDNKTNNPLKADSFSLGSEHYYNYVKSKDAKVGKPYLPRLMTREQAYAFVKHVERAFKSVSALENLVSLFSKVNTETTSETRTFMSPARILRCFINYIVASSIGMGYKLLNKIDPKEVKNSADNGRYLYQTCGITLRFISPAPLKDSHLKLCDPLETPAEVNLGYSLCDKIFEMCIKSMSAKILTILGTYSLFHRPVKTMDLFRSTNPAYSTHPLRQILGGSQAYVDIDPKATELYIRLPLLVEWYRNVFEFVKADPSTIPEHDLERQKDPLISLIPEFDSVWRDLVFTIFIDGSKIDDGAYPAEYAHRIINSITEIYNKYKSAKRDITCKQIIEEFVLEINRRYGFLLREEINTYLNEREEMLKSQPVDYQEEDRNEYDLLDSESDLSRLPAPSDRFRTTPNYRNRQRSTIDSFWNAVRKFRYSVEKNLLLDNLTGSSNPALKDLNYVQSNISLSNIVKNTQAKIAGAKSAEERYRLILGQLHGVERFSNVDQHKLVLLHETVITPLTILYYVYLIMNDYNKLLVSMNTEKLNECIKEMLELTTCNNIAEEYAKLYNSLQTGARLDANIFDKPFENNGSATMNGKKIQYNHLAPIAHLILPHLLLKKNNKNFKGESNQHYGFKEDELNIYNFKEGIACSAEILKYFTCLLPVNYLFEAQSHIGATQQKIVRYFAPFTSREMPNFNGITTSHYIDSYSYFTTKVYQDDATLQDYLTKLSWNNTVANGATKADKQKLLERVAIDEQRLLKDIMGKLMNLTTDLSGFVDVYFPSENKTRYLTANFDRLEQICVNLFQNLKQNLNNLRKNIPYELVDSIENNLRSDGSVNAVSLFYLQEQLFDRLFRNKYGNGLPDSNKALKNIWLHINKEYDYNAVNLQQLTFHKIKSVDGANLIDERGNTVLGFSQETVDNFKAIGPINMYQNTVNPAISSLLFWDITGDYSSHNSVYANTHHMGHRYMNGAVKTLGSFPDGYIPIFRSGASINAPKTKDEREKYAIEMANGYKITGLDDVNKVNSIFNTSNCIIKFQIERNAGGVVADSNLIFSGYRNLYDKAKYFHRNFVQESGANTRLTLGFEVDPLMANLKEAGAGNAIQAPVKQVFSDYYKLNIEHQYPISPFSVDNFKNLDNVGDDRARLSFRNPYMILCHGMDRAAAGDIVWNAAKINKSKAVPHNISTEDLRTYDQHPLNKANIGYIYDPSQLGYRHIEKYYNPAMHGDTLNGLLVQFNSLVHDYFATFIDPSNKKIYKSLVDKFVNGYNSKDILQGKNINDLVSFLDNFHQFDKVLNRSGLLSEGNKTILMNNYFSTSRDRSLDITAAGNHNITNTNVLGLLSAVLYQEPQRQATLFATLANAIKVLCTSKQERVGGPNVPQFIEDNFANVTELEKDSMRAYLPLFNKYLEVIAKKTEFVKQIIEQTSCKVYKPYLVSDQHLWFSANDVKTQIAVVAAGGDDEKFDNGAGAVPTHYPDDYNKVYLGKQAIATLTVPPYGNKYNTGTLILHDGVDASFTQKNKIPIFENEASRKSYLIGIATDLIASVRSLQSCILSTQKDLSDVPLFFETYKDSIASYYTRLQQYPFMPLSMTTHLMNINNFRFNDEVIESDSSYHYSTESKARYNLLLTPSEFAEGVGTTKFKILYGTRGIMDHKQKPSIEYMPGMMQILDSEKMFGVKSGVVDKSNAQEFLNYSVPLIRFVLDQFYMMPYLNDKDYSSVRNLVVNNQFALSKTPLVSSPVMNLTCYTGKHNSKESPEYWQNTQNVIISVENDSLRQSVYRLIACMQQRGTNILYEQDRNKMRIWNILDLNLVPINFHGLQREVPWANLLNYSYTFDHLIKDEIGITFKHVALGDIRGYKPIGASDDGDAPLGVAPKKRGGLQAFSNAVFDSNIKEYVYSSRDFNQTLFVEDQLVRQIIYPYGFRRVREYIRDTYKLMAGVSSHGLGRPKYLSDQLWNKVLFNNLFDNKTVSINSSSNAAREIASSKSTNSANKFDTLKAKLISYFLTNHQNEIFTYDKADLFISHALHAAYSFMHANDKDPNSADITPEYIMNCATALRANIFDDVKLNLLTKELTALRVITRKDNGPVNGFQVTDTKSLKISDAAGANKIIVKNTSGADAFTFLIGDIFEKYQHNHQVLSLLHAASLIPNAYYTENGTAVGDLPFHNVSAKGNNAAALNADYTEATFNLPNIRGNYLGGDKNVSIRQLLHYLYGKAQTAAGIVFDDLVPNDNIDHVMALYAQDLYYMRWANPTVAGADDMINLYGRINAAIGGLKILPAVGDDAKTCFAIGLYNGILSAIDTVECTDETYDATGADFSAHIFKVVNKQSTKLRFTAEDCKQALKKLSLGFTGAKLPLIGAKDVITKVDGKSICFLRPFVNSIYQFNSNTQYLHYGAGTTYSDFFGVSESDFPSKYKNNNKDLAILPEITNVSENFHLTINTQPSLLYSGEALEKRPSDRFLQGPTQQYINFLALTSHEVDTELNTLRNNVNFDDENKMIEYMLDALQKGIDKFNETISTSLYGQINRNGLRTIEINGGGNDVQVSAGNVAAEDANTILKNNFIKFGTAGTKLLGAVFSDKLYSSDKKIDDISRELKDDLIYKISHHTLNNASIYLLNKVFAFPSRKNVNEIDLYTRICNPSAVPYQVGANAMKTLNAFDAPYPIRNDYYGVAVVKVDDRHNAMNLGFVQRYRDWENNQFNLNALAKIIDNDLNPYFVMLAFNPDPQFKSAYRWTNILAQQQLIKKCVELNNLIETDIRLPTPTLGFATDNAGKFIKAAMELHFRNDKFNENPVYLTNLLMSDISGGGKTHEKTEFRFPIKPIWSNDTPLDISLNNTPYEINNKFGYLGPILTLQSYTEGATKKPCGNLLYQKSCQPNLVNYYLDNALTAPIATTPTLQKMQSLMNEIQEEFLINIQKGIDEKFGIQSLVFQNSYNLDYSEPFLNNFTTTNNIPSSILNHLSYVSNKQNVVPVITNQDHIKKLAYEGYLRYNTNLIRNIVWTVDLQRAMRINLRKQLEWIQDPVVQKQDAVAEENDDYVNNNVYKLDDFE